VISCDTEDWSNDAENTALIKGINYILQYIQVEKVILNCNNISLFFCFSAEETSFKYIFKNLTDPKLFICSVISNGNNLNVEKG